MSRKLFTEEQIAALRQNPYVYSVSRSTLVLRKSFKEIFYTEYMEGVYPKDVFKKYGFDPAVLGERRIGGALQPPPRSSLKMTLRPSDMKLNTCGRKWNI